MQEFEKDENILSLHTLHIKQESSIIIIIINSENILYNITSGDNN